MGLDVSRLDAVLFDLDDTLVNWRHAERLAIQGLARTHFAPLAIAEETVRSTYDEVMAENVRSWNTLRRWWYISERLDLLSKRLGTHDRLPGTALADAFTEDVATHLALLDGAVEAVRAARKGRKTAILTNGRPESQRPKLERFGLHHEVDFVGITGELGSWKPDPEAFHKVLRQLGVAPERACMVGDSLDFDIRPARAIGMQTVLVGGDPHPDAHHHAPTPRHLLQLLPSEVTIP
jgi:HAD superfamily hydrolase (TIGR01509 family)